MEIVALIVTVVGCTATGAWVVRSGLSGLEHAVSALEKALAIHVVEERSEREKLAHRLKRLEEERDE